MVFPHIRLLESGFIHVFVYAFSFQVVLTDPDRLRGIILNLYTNAAKFTVRGFIDLSVSVSSRDYSRPPDSGYSNITVAPSYRHAAANGLSVLRMKGWPGHRLSLKQKFRLERRSLDSIPRPQKCSGDLSQSSEIENSRAETAGDESGPLSGEPDSACTVEECHGLKHHRSKGPDVSTVDTVACSGVGGDCKNHSEECAHSRWLLFEVVDSGVGISDKGLHSLFQEYVQGATEEMSRPRTRAGTGLGLSICSKQVRARATAAAGCLSPFCPHLPTNYLSCLCCQVAVLGGRIGAYSKLGSGSVFWFTIPLMTPAKKKQPVLRRCSSWTCESVLSDSHYEQAAAARVQSKWPLAHRLVRHLLVGPLDLEFVDRENANSWDWVRRALWLAL